jgi:oligopeptide transport system permease protein
MSLRALFENRPPRTFLWSLGFLVGIALLAVLAPWITRFSYEEQLIADRLQNPNWIHWMGTDSLGRDLFSRILYGARISLSVGASSACFALLIGTLAGGFAGYRGGWVDRAIMWSADVIYVLPGILVAILLTLLFGRGFLGILVAIGLTSWVTQARLVRAQVLLARELPYVEAARAIGASESTILFRHVLPNLWGPILVSISIQIPGAIMAESFLSFIGLGLQPPVSSWGTLANEGFRAIRSFPHLIVFPGAALFLTLLAFNYLGDGLRDLLDRSSHAAIGPPVD